MSHSPMENKIQCSTGSQYVGFRARFISVYFCILSRLLAKPACRIIQSPCLGSASLKRPCLDKGKKEKEADKGSQPTLFSRLSVYKKNITKKVICAHIDNYIETRPICMKVRRVETVCPGRG